MSVNDQLARIIKSPPLVSSPSLCRFLRYIVEETMAGRASGIKEQVLGLEVFDRGHDFNPRLDPIVRVQARNLRSRMAKYYEGPGRYDPIRIELPKGTYIPVFHEVNPVNGGAGGGPAPEVGADNPPVQRAGESPRITALKASESVMPVPPPRSPVAGQPQIKPRFMVASLILMGILAVLAVVLITRTHAASVTTPGPLSGRVSSTAAQSKTTRKPVPVSVLARWPH